MEQAHKSEMMCVLGSKMRILKSGGRSVFLFGHCNATEEMADYLFAKGIAPAGILDNSVSKQGLAYRGIPVVPPEMIQNFCEGDSIVLIATRFFAEMAAQLRRLGYDGEIVQAAQYDTFAEYSLSDEVVGRKKARMLSGLRALGRIREAYPTHHLVVCPFGALGDAYWAMAFLPAYCKKHGIRDAAVIVAGGGCRQVAGMFGMDDILALDQAGMDELVQALIFTREENCIIAHHDRPYTDNIIKYLDKRFLSFIDYYRYAVYGLPKGSEPAAPSRLSPITEAAGLPEGKSVIIAPYAKSVTQPPAVFWEKLAGEWQGRGYRVFTSVASGELPIAGTAALSLPLGQLVSAAEFAGVFIGLRSGLCDIVRTAECRKIVVFPDCCYSSTPHKVSDFFALPGWEKIIL